MKKLSVRFRIFFLSGPLCIFWIGGIAQQSSSWPWATLVKTHQFSVSSKGKWPELLIKDPSSGWGISAAEKSLLLLTHKTLEKKSAKAGAKWLQKQVPEFEIPLLSADSVLAERIRSSMVTAVRSTIVSGSHRFPVDELPSGIPIQEAALLAKAASLHLILDHSDNPVPFLINVADLLALSPLEVMAVPLLFQTGMHLFTKGEGYKADSCFIRCIGITSRYAGFEGITANCLAMQSVIAAQYGNLPHACLLSETALSLAKKSIEQRSPFLEYGIASLIAINSHTLQSEFLPEKDETQTLILKLFLSDDWMNSFPENDRRAIVTLRAPGFSSLSQAKALEGDYLSAFEFSDSTHTAVTRALDYLTENPLIAVFGKKQLAAFRILADQTEALCYSFAGQHSQALRIMDNALGRNPNEGLTIAQSGTLAVNRLNQILELGLWDSSATYQAINLIADARIQKQPITIGGTFSVLGKYYLLAGQFAKSIVMSDSTIRYGHDHSVPSLIVNGHLLKSLCLLETGQMEAAREVLFNHVPKIEPKATLEEKISIREKQAIYYLMNHAPDSALKLILSGLSYVYQGLDFGYYTYKNLREKTALLYDLAIKAAIRTQQPILALEYIDERSFLELRLLSQSKIPDSLRTVSGQSLSKVLNQMRNSSPELRDSLMQEFFNIYRKDEIRRLKSVFSPPNEDLYPVETSLAQKAQTELLENEALVVFSEAKDSLFVAILSKYALQVCAIGGIDSTRAYVQRLDRFLSLPRPIPFSSLKTAKELMPPFFDSLISLLPTGISRIIFVPDRLTLRIPFPALIHEVFNSYSKNMPIEPITAPFQMEFSQYPSLSVWMRSRASDVEKIKKTGKIMVFAHPELPGASFEGEQVIAQSQKWGYEIISLQGEKHFKDWAQKKSENIELAHFATHSVIPFRGFDFPGLLFTPNNGLEEDGVLFQWELKNLELNADLVVLSACQSANGTYINGEGISSISNALIASGTKAVVASIWDVGDQASGIFFSLFYPEWFKTKNLSHALSYAQAQMKKSERFYDPFYWAGFIAIAP